MIIILVICYLKAGLLTQMNKVFIYFSFLSALKLLGRKDLCDTFKGPRQTIERRQISLMEILLPSVINSLPPL